MEKVDEKCEWAFGTLFSDVALPTLTALRDEPNRIEALAHLLLHFDEELEARQHEVLRRTLGLSGGRQETLEAVGQDLGVSKERVNAVVKQALRRLRKAAVAAGLEPSALHPPAPTQMHALQLYEGSPTERAVRVASSSQEDLRREAVQACGMRDADKLWALMDAYLTLHGGKGSRVSKRTRESYKRGMQDLLRDWARENLLRPSRDAGVVWVRELEQRPVVQPQTGEPKRDMHGEMKTLSPTTVQVKLAAARTLYKALRWAGATQATPFENVRVAKDPVPAWEKRGAYTPDEVEQLLAVAEDTDKVMVLLGAHAGLRIAEISALRWGDIDWRASELIVRKGKGGKTARVAMTRRLKEALQSCPRDAHPDGYVLPYRAYRARERFQKLCLRAGITYEGREVHGLRHGAGTRVYRQFNDLARVAQHLRQASVDTARRYAKMADREIHEGIEEW